MGDVSRPDVVEVSFETVGEGIFALSIVTAEIANAGIEGGVGIKLARDAFVKKSVVVYSDSAGKDEFEPMADSAAINSVDDAVLCGTLVAERSN